MKKSKVKPFIDKFPLRTERTQIRLLNKKDCRWYAEEVHKEYYTEYSDNKAATTLKVDHIKNRLYTLIDSIRHTHEFNYELRTVAIHRDTHEPCGGVNIHPTDYSGEVEISYWVKPEYQHNGLATEIVKGVINSIFTIKELNEIKIVIQSSNIASIIVAERLGARYMYSVDGRYDKNLVYRIRK